LKYVLLGVDKFLDIELDHKTTLYAAALGTV